MATVKVISNTIRLPDEVMEELDLKDGDELIVTVEEDEIILTPKDRLDREVLFERTSKLGEELAERLGEEELSHRIDKAAAVARMRSVADQVATRLEEEGMTQEDLQQQIDEEVAAVRQERYERSQRREDHDDSL